MRYVLISLMFLAFMFDDCNTTPSSVKTGKPTLTCPAQIKYGGSGNCLVSIPVLGGDPQSGSVTMPLEIFGEFPPPLPLPSRSFGTIDIIVIPGRQDPQNNFVLSCGSFPVPSLSINSGETTRGMRICDFRGNCNDDPATIYVTFNGQTSDKVTSLCVP